MICRKVAMNLLQTAFLVERDKLTNCVALIANGFITPSILAETNHHTNQISKYIAKMESISTKKTGDSVANDYYELMK